MLITLTLKDGTTLEWRFAKHSAIDKMVEALKENAPEWFEIMITIEKETGA
jgi:hypothetical protein